MGRPLSSAEFLVNCFESGRFFVIPIHITQRGRELGECCCINTTVFFEAIFGPRAELVQSSSPPSPRQ